MKARNTETKMNKKELLVTEAKRLFGQYGYLGFTLKHLAKACQMTSPALYYFYDSKADLFKDCMLAELEVRHQVVANCIKNTSSFIEFAVLFAEHAIDVCTRNNFTVARGMQDVIHLPDDIRKEIEDLYYENLVYPIENALISYGFNKKHTARLQAEALLNIAAFIGIRGLKYPQDELIKLMISLVHGMTE
jgi:AcrR family transcriptional regulator